jgi:hypothetical protein
MAGQAGGQTLAPSDVDELRATFRGEVVDTGDARYDEFGRCSTGCSIVGRG